MPCKNLKPNLTLDIPLGRSPQLSRKLIARVVYPNENISQVPSELFRAQLPISGISSQRSWLIHGQLPISVGGCMPMFDGYIINIPSVQDSIP